MTCVMVGVNDTEPHLRIRAQVEVGVRVSSGKVEWVECVQRPVGVSPAYVC